VRVPCAGDSLRAEHKRGGGAGDGMKESRKHGQYFKLRVYIAGKAHHVVVWDGVRDYESHPAIEGLAATGQFGQGEIGELGIVQISKRSCRPPIAQNPFSNVRQRCPVDARSCCLLSRREQSP
jgi:hypothetical protein